MASDNKYYSWFQVLALVVLIICAGAAQAQIPELDSCVGGCREGIVLCSADCASKAFSPQPTIMPEMISCLGACGAQILGCMGECFDMRTPSSAGEPTPSPSRPVIPASWPPTPPPRMDQRQSYRFN